MAQQLGQPLGVADVALAPRHHLDVRGVDQQQREALLEQVPDRLPVDPGALHRHVGRPRRPPASRPAPAGRPSSSRRSASPWPTARPARAPSGRRSPTACAGRARSTARSSTSIARSSSVRRGGGGGRRLTASAVRASRKGATSRWCLGRPRATLGSGLAAPSVPGHRTPAAGAHDTARFFMPWWRPTGA